MPLGSDDDASVGILAALLGGKSGGLLGGKGLLGGRGLLDAGPSPDMAYMEAIQGSPFYQGVPSQSGPFGQIAQALMPLIQATQAEQQATEAAAIREKLIAVEMQKAQREQQMAEFQQLLMSNPQMANALAGQLNPGVTLKLGDATIKGQEQAPELPPIGEQIDSLRAQGATNITVKRDKFGRQVAEGRSPTSGPLDKAASAMMSMVGALNQSANKNEEFIKGEGGSVLRLKDGYLEQVPVLDRTAQQEGMKRFNTLQTFKMQLGLAEDLWKDAPPGGYGFSSSLDRGVAGAFDQAIGAANNVRRRMAWVSDSASVQSGNFDLESKNEITSSWWYKALTDANTTGTRLNTVYATLVFEGARAIAGQEGRALSDGDAERVERILGIDGIFGDAFVTPPQALAGIDELKNVISNIESESISEIGQAYGPGGQYFGGAFGMPERFAIDPQTTKKPEAKQKIAAYLDSQGIPSGLGRARLIHSLMVRMGYGQEE